MEHDPRLLSRSYLYIEHSGNGRYAHGRVAEEQAEYNTDASNQCKHEPEPEPEPEPDSKVLTEHHRQGQTLHLAMALLEGTQLAAADRQTHVEQLRSLTQRAAGRETRLISAQTSPSDGVEGADGAEGGDETDKSCETDEALIKRLKHLLRAHDRNMAEQLALYLEVDQRELWRQVGCQDCVHWMDRELGINRNAAFERLRAARALRELPVIESLFALGKLVWSKVRELTRVATPANEQELAAAALELGASETVQLCQRWRHADIEPGTEQHTDSPDAREAAQAALAWRQRSLRWRSLPGTQTTRITLDLPADSAAELLKALEAMEELDATDVTDATIAADAAEAANDESPTSDSNRTNRTNHTNHTNRTPTQRRADAMLLMSAKALAHAGPAVATADRYQVLVTIDSRLLGADAEAHRTAHGTTSGELPPERPAIQGFGPIAVTTAQRLASQARLTIVATDTEGDVVATGRNTRLFSASTTRALIARDRCCQMPGCTQSRTGWLHAHHVIPWVEGGESTLGNAALLCSSCHVRLHEGGLKLEQVDKRSVALSEHELLSLTAEEQAIARAKIAAVQRFRLLRGDGSWVAGPRRYDQPARSASEEFLSGDSRQDVSPHRSNLNAAHWGNTLEQYRVAPV